MAINFEWVVKHLTADNRGYATIGVFEMQGVDDSGATANGSVTVCFGADELKPLRQWSDADIDAYAESKRGDIEQFIIESLTARITALEAK